MMLIIQTPFNLLFVLDGFFLRFMINNKAAESEKKEQKHQISVHWASKNFVLSYHGRFSNQGTYSTAILKNILSPHFFFKFKCNATSDWLNRMV